MPELTFERAEDQQKAARDAFEAMFFDEDERWWMVARGRSGDEAIDAIVKVEQPESRPTARRVRGALGMRGCDVWFERETNGPVAMWEIGFF